MNIKGLFAGKPAFTQLIVLVLLTLVSSLVTSFLVILLTIITKGGMDLNLMEHPDLLRWGQLVSAIGTFLFPALGLAYLCGTDLRGYLSIGRMPQGKIVFLLFLGYILLGPTMNLTQYLNQQMTLPAFMEPIESWMKMQEETMMKFTLTLMADNDWVSFLFNLLVIAIAAGITEEFFFRGALQRIFERWGMSPHVVIWVTAIVFSAFHLQFYGFVPRMLIGAYLGYLLLWSRNIWVPVTAHIINNAVAVVGMSNSKLKELEYINGEFNAEHILPLTVATIISFFFLVPLLRKIKKELS